MPQMSTVVLTDNAAVDHSFQPRGFDQKGVALLIRSTGVPIGDEQITVQRSKTAQGREKVQLVITVPTVQTATVDGVSEPRVVRTAYANVQFSFDRTSSTAERGAIRAMLSDLLGNSQALASAVVDDLETLY